MRRTVQEQQKLVPIPVAAPHSAELAEMSRTFDDHQEIDSTLVDEMIERLRTGRCVLGAADHR